jgi:hypothetical protein
VHSIVYHGRSTQYNVLLKNQMRIQVFEQNEEHFPQEVIDYDNEVNLYWQRECGDPRKMKFLPKPPTSELPYATGVPALIWQVVFFIFLCC